MTRKRKKRGVVAQIARVMDTSTTSITPDQYNRGWDAYHSGGTEPEVQARSGMTRKQFHFLLHNPLPGHEDQCPSYFQRMSDMATVMRLREGESAATLSAGTPRNIKARDNIARMAEVALQLLTSNRVAALVANSQKDADDLSSGWQPNHKLVWTTGEVRMVKQLERLADYTPIADTFHKIYENPAQQMNPINQLPKGTKFEFGIDPTAVLPASVTAVNTVTEANNQAEEDFHQRLFRDFGDMSESELEDFIAHGGMPDRELRRRVGEDGPDEL